MWNLLSKLSKISDFTVDDNAEKFLRRLHSAGLLPGRPFIAFDDEPTTLAPMWTRPTTPKDTLVHYFEQTLDAFLNGKFQPKAPKSYLLDNDYLLQRKKEMAVSNVEKNRNRDGKSVRNWTLWNFRSYKTCMPN